VAVSGLSAKKFKAPTADAMLSRATLSIGVYLALKPQSAGALANLAGAAITLSAILRLLSDGPMVLTGRLLRGGNGDPWQTRCLPIISGE
jgi:hypothetical protein